MKTKLVVRLVAGLFTFGMAGVASALPITFTHTGIGSGSIDNISFVNESFSITATGDTDDRFSLENPSLYGYSIDNLSASIDIDSVGVYEFITRTRTFVNNSNRIVGFGRGLNIGSGFDLFDGPTSPSFTSWDMLSDIGPITGSGMLVDWSDTPIQTNGGQLLFNTQFNVPATFQAVINTVSVPEPATMLLFGTGIAGLAGTRYKRSAKACLRRFY